MTERIKVALTGATGVMGEAGLQELASRLDLYDVTVLARPSKRNRSKLAPYEAKGVRVVWGDLLDPASIGRLVEGVDIVLHVGGMVSPLADWHPEETMRVNVGSMRLLTEAVHRREQADPGLKVAFVGIGSVAQYGDHLPPDEWGDADTPQTPAKFDMYAASKVESEKVLRAAGLRKWVMLRQTGIMHPGLLGKTDDPIMFHVPLKGVLEWVSVEDSGRLLERVCRPEVPDDFWGKAYNIGGGEAWRMTNLDFERRILAAVRCPPPEKIFDFGWFATANFHGMYFRDSDHLDEILHFRSGETPDEWFARLKGTLPWYFKLTPLAPPFILKAWMRHVASKPVLGPLWWRKHGVADRLAAHFPE